MYTRLNIKFSMYPLIMLCRRSSSNAVEFDDNDDSSCSTECLLDDDDTHASANIQHTKMKLDHVPKYKLALLFRITSV